MRIPLPTLAALLLGIQPCFALDRMEILDLTKKPHSRENLLPELKIFADARSYRIDYESHPLGQPPGKLEPVTAREWVVEGRYLITIWRPAGAPGEVAMVVTFDQDSSTYRKWILIPDGQGTVLENIGTAVPGSRTISWINTNDPENIVLTQEQHTDTGATWTELHLSKGKIVRRGSGTATKLK